MPINFNAIECDSYKYFNEMLLDNDCYEWFYRHENWQYGIGGNVFRFREIDCF